MTAEKSEYFLLLGEADREAVTSKIKSSGERYVKKRLDSSLANWETIYPLVQSADVKGIIAKISNPTLSMMISEEYYTESDAILRMIAAKPHIVFVHESFYRNEFDDISDNGDDPVAQWYHSYGSVTNEVRSSLINLFERHKVDVRSYATNAEFSTESVEFIDSVENNLIFRMYVSNERMWSDEIKKVISLFRDYLNKVCSLTVTQSEYSTRNGTVYELYTENKFGAVDIESTFTAFTTLLDVSSKDVARAKEMLVAQSVAPEAAEEIVRRYAKEAKRLNLDFRQERERKMLDVRHRMESELTDILETEEQWNAANALAEKLMPDVGSVSGLLGGSSSSVPIANQTFITNHQIIESVHGIVAATVTGNQTFGADASQVARLINEFGGANGAALLADLHELEDESAKLERRATAKGKLLSFLGKVATRTSEAAVAIAQSYIEKKLGI